MSDKHSPICAMCGKPWPCAEEKFSREAEWQTHILLKRVAYEVEHPWPCPWCARFKGRTRGFRTERGLHQHIRNCRANPSLWNFDHWIPTFNEKLHMVGGYRPQAHTSMATTLKDLGMNVETHEKSLAFAQVVRDAALNGRLPATRAELQR